MAARTSRGYSQEKLGVLIGLDEETASTRISRYESGIHEPAIDTAKRLAAALGVPMAYLYCEEDDLAQLLVLASNLKNKDLQDLNRQLLKKP